MRSLHGEETPQPLGIDLWNWNDVKRVLIVRLRSIGDTVLSTPSIYALRRFLPNARIDLLLEEWVAPVLEGHPDVSNILTVAKGSTSSRMRLARQLRANGYDVVYNLHGGSTSTLLTRATGAPHRIGYSTYQYSRLHNHIAPSSALLWSRAKVHSVEQQLALFGWTGVPVSDRPPTRLAVTERAAAAINLRLTVAGLEQTPFAVVHPAAAFATKQWAALNFAEIAKELEQRGLAVIVITTAKEAGIIENIRKNTATNILALTDLSLPEITALLARARLFVGNDSGIAHMAAAMETPAVVIFGSSNRAHWSPWAKAPSQIVFEEMECQPCHGYYCEKFSEPECIKRVPVERVTAAIERVIRESAA